MIRLIKKILLIFALILLVNLWMKKMILPYAWADNVLSKKMEGYAKPKDNYNALFVGASLTYRQVDPNIVDSIAHMQGVEFHSYNMAVDAQNFIKIIDNFEFSKQIENPHLEYVFIELSSSMEIYFPSLHTVKSFYWVEMEQVIQAFKMIKEYPVNLLNKALYGFAYSASWIENKLSFGAFPKALEFYFAKKKKEDFYTGKLHNGFYPYTLNPRNLLMGTKIEEQVIFEERKILMENPDTIMANIKSKTLFEYERGGGKKLLQSQLDICLNIIEKNKEKGIETVFILPPRGRGNYNILLPIFNKLPNNNKIDLGNPLLYPEFYTVENSFNFFHLNEQGAAIYSRVLGEKIVELLK